MDLERKKRPRPSSKCIYMIYLCTRMYLCFECQTHSLSHTHTNIYMYIRICAYVHINTHRERVIFIRVDVEKKDAKTLIKDRAGVNSIPTFQVWKSGTFRDQYVAGSFFRRLYYLLCDSFSIIYGTTVQSYVRDSHSASQLYI